MLLQKALYLLRLLKYHNAEIVMLKNMEKCLEDFKQDIYMYICVSVSVCICVR